MLPAIAGKRLGEVCQTRIFAPLGMDETTFELADALRQRVASMHARNADGSLAPIDFELRPGPKCTWAGTGSNFRTDQTGVRALLVHGLRL